MLILSQDREMLINMTQVNAITIDKRKGKQGNIVAWIGAGEYDFWTIGKYENHERAKIIIGDIYGHFGAKRVFTMPEK